MLKKDSHFKLVCITCSLITFLYNLNIIFNLILHFKPKISTSFGPKGFTFCHNFALKNLEYVCKFFYVSVFGSRKNQGERGRFDLIAIYSRIVYVRMEILRRFRSFITNTQSSIIYFSLYDKILNLSSIF